VPLEHITITRTQVVEAQGGSSALLEALPVETNDTSYPTSTAQDLMDTLSMLGFYPALTPCCGPAVIQAMGVVDQGSSGLAFDDDFVNFARRVQQSVVVGVYLKDEDYGRWDREDLAAWTFALSQQLTLPLENIYCPLSSASTGTTTDASTSTTIGTYLLCELLPDYEQPEQLENTLRADDNLDHLTIFGYTWPGSSTTNYKSEFDEMAGKSVYGLAVAIHLQDQLFSQWVQTDEEVCV
jgi:hypothetical protein